MSTWASRFLLMLVVAAGLAVGGCGKHRDAGQIEGKALPASLVAGRAAVQKADSAGLAESAATEAPDTQILFGDLHVHTTFSADAFMMSLPILQGDGAHPVADACDFARYCSALDFWSINDHAEALTPLSWSETKESIRQCNALAGDPANPDVVAFLGWEWSQVGLSVDDHYGHKNVIFVDTEDDKVPARPIHAGGITWRFMRQKPPLWQRAMMPLADWPNRQHYFEFARFRTDLGKTPICEEGVDVRELGPDCQEGATTPAVLFEKLSQWDFDTIVIPHGNAWGLYTPARLGWHKQLAGGNHGPDKQTLIEVFSGHGNAEEYRRWRPDTVDDNGNPLCPLPIPGYESCCWRAGEIVRSRCENPDSESCQAKVDEAVQNYIHNGLMARTSTIGGTVIKDWGDCGTCRDCYLPAFNYRPSSSVQAALASSHFDGEGGEPERFRFGFIASSDNHTARPGNGYKEFARQDNTEARGPKDEAWRQRMAAPLQSEPPTTDSVKIDFDTFQPTYYTADFERQASFFMTGGLVAVHSRDRSRGQIWKSLKRREVYGTSGPRILLWFDLTNGSRGTHRMGEEVVMADNPRFRVRALGSFEQKPGCPELVLGGLSAQRLQKLCRGECYNPGDKRRAITRIEVVRIRPQQSAGEALGDLIEDPWRVFDCPADGAGCSVEFEDPAFSEAGREVIYYVRAIEEPSLAVNADHLRCSYDGEGNCIEVNPCYGDYRVAASDDCLAPNQERAWSSPIYVRPAGG
ncbi:MAG: DUF3604 domain-containing protein [Deltaproteobacteria bacterium]